MTNGEKKEKGSSSGICFDLHDHSEIEAAHNSSAHGSDDEKSGSPPLLPEQSDKSSKETTSTPTLRQSSSGGSSGRGVETAAGLGELSIHDDSSNSTISCYLCIKVNKNKDYISCPLNRKMKNRLTSEFWFQINDNRYVYLSNYLLV